ncbi:MAG: phage integrase SAM-like domain-containing protein [Lachnospiraceae bacterium]|nr:phage integrase SAM-like domain-containing protein [Lachnospiraceae bacterium]
MNVISTKYDLRPNTFHTYKYLYEHYVGDVIGKKKLAELRYADMVHFYFYLIEEKQLKVRTVEYIHIILHSVFDMAIKDEIIRQNPTQGIMAQVKKKTGYSRESKDPLTAAQQQKLYGLPYGGSIGRIVQESKKFLILHFNIFKGVSNAILQVKIDNNFDNKFYRNRTEQYRIMLFWRSC